MKEIAFSGASEDQDVACALRIGNLWKMKAMQVNGRPRRLFCRTLFDRAYSTAPGMGSGARTGQCICQHALVLGMNQEKKPRASAGGLFCFCELSEQGHFLQPLGSILSVYQIRRADDENLEGWGILWWICRGALPMRSRTLKCVHRVPFSCLHSRFP